MKSAVVVRALMLLTLICCAFQAHAALQLIDTVNLRERQGLAPDENVLKLHGAAVDATRNLVYAAGIVTPAIGVLDGATEKWTRTYATGIDGFALKYLEVDNVANRLYISETAGDTLRGIDLVSGALIGPVDIPHTLATPVADSRRGLVYMTFPDSPTFRAFDGGSLSLVYATDAMGAGAAHVIWDESSDLVYVLDALTSGQLRIHKFDPGTRAVTGNITLALSAGQRPYKMAYDAAGQRFFVVAGPKVLAVSAAGTLLGQMTLAPTQDTQDISYDPDRNEVVVLVIDKAANGTQAASGGHLLFFDATSHVKKRDLPLSKKPHTLSYNRANHRYYLPESDASTLWSVADGGADLRGLHLGDSAEMVALARGGENIYVTSRLGGSYLVELRASASSLQTFTAGFWPIPIRVGDGGNELYVLNAWDSTLSVFDLATNITLSATIPLGLVKGTTDRLPDLAIDSTRQRAYAAYPEFGKIAVVDLAQRSALNAITVPDFPTGDTGGGPGQLQVAVMPASGRLFAYRQSAKRLMVWDISGATPVFLLDQPLNGMPNIDASFDQMFIDRAKNRVYAGPMEVDGSTGQPTGRKLGRGERVIGLDESANVLWASAIEIENGASVDVVAKLNRDTLAVIDAVTRGPAPPVMSTQYAFDASRQRLYAADPQEALLRVYSTAQTALLTVAKSGTGSGNVISNPAGIDCGSTCSGSFSGTVILTATPAAGSSFAGWSGDCAGTGSCAVTMNAAKGVTATFNTLPNYSDSWWNANESGWGITITDHGANAFVQWYTYDQTGHNQKYVIAGGTFSSDKCQFAGTLTHVTGPSWTAAGFDPNLVVRRTAGTGAFDFCQAGLTPGTIVFNYTADGVNGSKQLTRLPFGNDVPHWGGAANTGASDFTDLWWNPNESGWGVSVTQHGNNLLFRVFVYDTDGRPLLFIVPGVTYNSATSFTGDVTLTTGPWFGSAVFDPNQVTRTTAGTATLTFSDPNNGTLSYTVNGVTKTKAITRMVF